MDKDLFSQAFYDSPEWRRTREAYRKSVGGLCENCLKQGIYTPAQMVHHIQPLTPDNISNAMIRTDFSNLQALCLSCHHAIHHGTKHSRYEFLPNGEIIYK